MTIAARLQRCLQSNQCQYDLVPHPQSHTSMESARRAGVPAGRFAKPVILGDTQGHYMMAVVPADRQISLEKIRQSTRHDWRLAKEKEFQAMFSDCEVGAIPPVGSAYGMETVIDSSLIDQQDIYFEAGDHEALVHMRTDQFLRLMPTAARSKLSQ